MTHNDDLRTDIYQFDDVEIAAHPIVERLLLEARADERAAIYADIAARALSETVVDAVSQAGYRWVYDQWQDAEFKRDDLLLDEEGLADRRPKRVAENTALLLSLGITESEAD